MGNPLRINRETRDQATRVALDGEITEESDLGDLGPLKSRVIFDLGGVKRINSCGVREWILFVNRVPPDRELYFERCSPAMIVQTNMIANFLRGGKIVSFSAPYYCEKCAQPREILLDVDRDFPDRKPSAPQRTCEKCGDVLVFDDVEESYLAFLKQ